MKKLFISQPMRGLTEEEIMSARELAIKLAEEYLGEKVIVIDSYVQNYPGETTKSTPIWYLGKSIQFLSEADIAYFGTGWSTARGCKIEHEIAKQYGIEIIEAEPELFNFGMALELLKSGKKLSRKGWNGKGMFVYYVPSGDFESYTEAGKSIADENGKVHYNPYFAIKNVNGSVSTWVPSINDTMAEDWEVVE